MRPPWKNLSQAHTTSCPPPHNSTPFFFFFFPFALFSPTLIEYFKVLALAAMQYTPVQLCLHQCGGITIVGTEFVKFCFVDFGDGSSSSSSSAATLRLPAEAPTLPPIFIHSVHPLSVTHIHPLNTPTPIHTLSIVQYTFGPVLPTSMWRAWDLWHLG